jgi:hypothetical protein
MAKRLLSLPIITVAYLLLIVTGSGNASIGNIKEFLDTCPKNDPVYSQIKNDFTIRHNGVPVVMDTIACSEPVSSMPIAQFTNELIILQSLRVIYYMDYGQSGHLPWTAGSLYPWMKSKISGINIQDGAGANSCCDDTWGNPPYFTYQPQDDQQRAYKRQWKSLSGTISLFAHEIRHVDGFPHPSCCAYARCDQTFDQYNLSPIGIQWWLNQLWLTGEINVGAACLDPDKAELGDSHRERYPRQQNPIIHAGNPHPQRNKVCQNQANQVFTPGARHSQPHRQGLFAD